jgi:hypothetical protein
VSFPARQPGELFVKDLSALIVWLDATAVCCIELTDESGAMIDVLPGLCLILT